MRPVLRGVCFKGFQTPVKVGPVKAHARGAVLWVPSLCCAGTGISAKNGQIPFSLGWSRWLVGLVVLCFASCPAAGLWKVAPCPVSFWQFPFCACFAFSRCLRNSLGTALGSQRRQS